MRLSYLTKNPEWENHKTIRCKQKVFLEKLAEELYVNNIKSRAIQFGNGKTTFQKHVVNAIENTGRRIQKETQRPSASHKRGKDVTFAKTISLLSNVKHVIDLFVKFIPIVKMTNKRIIFLYSAFYCPIL